MSVLLAFPSRLRPIAAPRPMRRRLGQVMALLGCAALLAGCQATKSITADTTCREYLQFPGNERSDAAIRISAEVPGVSSPGNPMWAMSLDAACGSSPSKTIREIFSHE